MANEIQCPRCYGRGYKPENRKVTATGVRLGLYLRTCPRCGGTGQIEAKPVRATKVKVTP